MRRHPSDERGSVTVFIALVFSGVLILIGAFVVDIGSQRVGRSDMQALADMVALDMSRLVDGSTKSTIEGRSSWSATLHNSVARNSTTLGTAPVVTAELGVLDPDTGGFTALTSGSAVPNAVRVRASTTVAFAFGILPSGGASRSAVGAAASTACFRLGSYAARLSTDDSSLLAGLVGSALGGSVTLDTGSYTGLAGADISLPVLAAQLGLGRVDELATTSVSVPVLLHASAAALRQDGDSADASVLDAVAGHVGALPDVDLGDLLHLTAGSGAAESATVNALDLLTGTAFLANGSALSIPDLSTRLPLTGTSITSALRVIQGAQEACGTVGASVSTSQVDLTVTGQPTSITLPATLTGLAVTAAANSTSLAVHVAPATGSLSAIVCGDATLSSPEGMDVAVTSQLATLTDLSQTLAVSGTITSPSALNGLLGGLLGGVVSVKVTGTLVLSGRTSQGAGTRTASIRVPVSPATYDEAVSTGSGSLGVDSATATATWTSGPTVVAKSLLGTVTLNAAQNTSVLNGVVSGLTTSVWTPLATAVDHNVVTPLAELLGVELGGADVYGLPRPSCTSPTLVG
jgi:hypothetical protein